LNVYFIFENRTYLNILKDSFIFLLKILLFEKVSFEILNISENDTISVEAAKVSISPRFLLS
jgi:hypothetical protein